MGGTGSEALNPCWDGKVLPEALALKAMGLVPAGVPMATLTIRNLDERTKAQPRIQAARHGRSMELELPERSSLPTPAGFAREAKKVRPFDDPRTVAAGGIPDPLGLVVGEGGEAPVGQVRHRQRLLTPLRLRTKPMAGAVSRIPHPDPRRSGDGSSFRA